ncbi:MAG: dihydroneopterin aldolase, partial [Waddliaceae bacterium]
MIGQIGFENLKILCVIGVSVEERREEQYIFVDLKVGVDISKSVKTDKLEDAVDYVAMAQVCTDIAVQRQYQLLEKYASEVLQALFDRFDIQEAWIKVKKPKALP